MMPSFPVAGLMLAAACVAAAGFAAPKFDMLGKYPSVLRCQTRSPP
jgi:hypothetical protein